MQRIFIDTNVVIDLLGNREPFAKDVQILFSKAERQELRLCVSSLSIANAYYALTRTYKIETAKKYLQLFQILVEIIPFDQKAIDMALQSKFTDLEDGFQYYMALGCQAEIIITRNKKDFKHAQLPVLTATEYLNRTQ